eukprot:3442848-Prymnesium_polylepis.1
MEALTEEEDRPSRRRSLGLSHADSTLVDLLTNIQTQLETLTNNVEKIQAQSVRTDLQLQILVADAGGEQPGSSSVLSRMGSNTCGAPQLVRRQPSFGSISGGNSGVTSASCGRTINMIPPVEMAMGPEPDLRPGRRGSLFGAVPK